MSLSVGILLNVSVGDERWADALNTSFLQNMLPEHIREKAVAMKPDLMDLTGSAPWVCSIE